MPMLKKIRKMGDKARRDFVRTCDKEFLYCVSECAKNVIKGNVPLTDSQKTTLRHRHQNAVCTSGTSDVSEQEPVCC